MKRTRTAWAATAWLVLSTILGPIGCSRAADTEVETQSEPPPVLPQPTTQNPAVEEEVSIGVADLPDEMSECASHWDSSILLAHLQQAYSYGQYQPYPTTPDFGYQFPRGLKSKQSRGLGCMNTLLRIGAMLRQYAGYYQPGALGNYLHQTVDWSYRAPFRYGGMGPDSPL
jgi:hypothetical protein